MCIIISPKFADGKWYFPSSDLEIIFDALKTDISSALPKFDMRYKSSTDVPMFVVKYATPLVGEGVECNVCKQKLLKAKLRAHMGKHYLTNELSVYACGFCGKEGCSINLKKTSHNTMIPESNCPMFTKFSLKPCESPKERNPCSNRPVKCEVCHVVYWSYALQHHYLEQHPEHSAQLTVSELEKGWMAKLK